MSKVNIDREEIVKILPHRSPFLFVDRVLELEPDRRIVAALELTGDEPHFAGHFPGNPIMPGVLIAEALAQTSGLLHALSMMEKGEQTASLFYLARADMKWLKPCKPKATLFLESRLQRVMGGLLSFRVLAHTKRDDIAKGALTIAAAKTAGPEEER